MHVGNMPFIESNSTTDRHNPSWMESNTKNDRKSVESSSMYDLRKRVYGMHFKVNDERYLLTEHRTY